MSWAGTQEKHHEGDLGRRGREDLSSQSHTDAGPRVGHQQWGPVWLKLWNRRREVGKAREEGCGLQVSVCILISKP